MGNEERDQARRTEKMAGTRTSPTLSAVSAIVMSVVGVVAPSVYGMEVERERISVGARNLNDAPPSSARQHSDDNYGRHSLLLVPTDVNYPSLLATARRVTDSSGLYAAASMSPHSFFFPQPCFATFQNLPVSIE